MEPQVTAHIDLSAIRHNAAQVRHVLLPDTGIIAIVKANAYGHGLRPVVNAIKGDVDMFGVTSIEEALSVRTETPEKAILNMSYTAASEVAEAINKKITVTVYDLDSAKMLHEEAAKLKRPLKVHVKIDTGMHRLGILPDDVPTHIPQIMNLPYFRVEGIYSHFADESDAAFVKEQFATMQNCLFALQRAGHVVPAVHMAKSAVLFESQDYHFDAVRPGLALYGYGPEGHDLQPSLTLKTVLMQKKRVSKGARIGYSQTYVAQRDMTIGVIPLGYAHGYDRRLSNKGHVLVDGWQCPVIGRVCMSQTIIDLSAVKSRLLIGDEVIAIGKQKNQEITVNQLAHWIASGGDDNPREIVTSIPESVHRVYL